jgi:uncharacterized RDD family membrane protein YckC
VFCPRCGKSVPDGAGFCPSCGASLTAAPAGAATAASSPMGGAPAAAAAMPSAGVAVPALYGGFWRRLAAFVIDGVIINVVMSPFGLGLWGSISALSHATDLDPQALAAIIAASMFVWLLRVIVTWLYGALFESSAWQATPGKKLLGLRVTDLDGRRISFARATGRAFGKWLSGVMLGIGYLIVAFTAKKQGLHDFIAGTVVRR